MKRYKIYFSLTNLLGDTQGEVVKLQTFFKAIIGSSAFGTWMTSEADYAVYIGAGGMLVDILLGCLYFETIYKN